MQRTKSFFIIMGSIYLIIAILAFFNIINIKTNIFLALSTTSLLISLSDICNSIASYILYLHDINFSMKRTHEYLIKKKEEMVMPPPALKGTLGAMPHNPSSPLNTDALIAILERDYPKMANAKKYIDLKSEWYIKTLDILQLIFFVLAISVFLIMPFIYAELAEYERASVLITVVAFSAICFGIGINEKVADISNKKFEFMNGVGIAIESKYSGYYSYMSAL